MHTPSDAHGTSLIISYNGCKIDTHGEIPLHISSTPMAPCRQISLLFYFFIFKKFGKFCFLGGFLSFFVVLLFMTLLYEIMKFNHRY